MSRRSTLAAFSSSRQMMMAWKVSGILAEARDHRLAAGLDALGDGDLALARQELDRAHLAQVHADRIVGAVGRLAALAALLGDGGAGRPSISSRPSDSSSASSSCSLGLGLVLLVGFDDVDAHVGEHRHRVFDLLGGDLLGGKHGVQLVDGDVAALLRLLDHLLDGGVGEIEQRAVVRRRRLRSLFLGFGCGLGVCRHAYLASLSPRAAGLRRSERIGRVLTAAAVKVALTTPPASCLAYLLQRGACRPGPIGPATLNAA